MVLERGNKMGLYFCDECGEGFDDDDNVCVESPVNGELVCEDCLTEIEAEICEPEQKEYNSDDKHALSISLEESFGEEGFMKQDD